LKKRNEMKIRKERPVSGWGIVNTVTKDHDPKQEIKNKLEINLP